VGLQCETPRSRRRILESTATEGDSPVSETSKSSRRIPSTAGHVKSRGKLGRPGSKAKYVLATDSELVPRGKGEKHPGEGSEIVSETVCLQAVEGRSRISVRVPDRVPFA
jgi:hypothetical protein